MEEKEQPKGEPHFVGKKDELIKAKRCVRTLEGRDVLIVYHQGVFYAMDCYCYHAAGNLLDGDIEELGGKLCIVCPKHSYKISLAEGESIYKIKVPGEPLPVVKWLSKGVKQRIHAISETNGNIYVKLSDNPSNIESDYFQGEKGKIEREIVEAKEKEKS